MAPKYTLALVLVVTLFCILPTSQSYGYFINPHEEDDMLGNVITQVDEISKDLWDSGFKIMSLILNNHLPSIVKQRGAVCGMTPRNRRNNNKTITIFAPPDESFSDDRDWNLREYHVFCDDKDWKLLERQFVSTKVDKEAFDSGFLQRDSSLFTCHRYGPRSFGFYPDYASVLVTDYGSINNASITHWNIYNDSYIIVHGVSNFFNRNIGWWSLKNISVIPEFY